MKVERTHLLAAALMWLAMVAAVALLFHREAPLRTVVGGTVDIAVVLFIAMHGLINTGTYRAPVRATVPYSIAGALVAAAAGFALPLRESAALREAIATIFASSAVIPAAAVVFDLFVSLAVRVLAPKGKRQ